MPLKLARGGVLSPDGRYPAYTSDESKQLEVYVRPYPDWQSWREKISADGGFHADWSPNGDAIFYFSEGNFMVTRIETEPAFRVVKREVFAQGYRSVVGASSCDVSLDGKRLLVVKGRGIDTADHVNIITNWFEELKRLVPTE